MKTDFKLERSLLCITALFLLTSTATFAQIKSIAARVDSVMKLMTLEEKVGQLNQYSGREATGPVTSRQTYMLNDIRSGRVGSMLNVHGVKNTKEIQSIALQSRLKIPLLFAMDVIHGYRTVFPIPLAEAASWDLDAIEQASHIAATESAAAGLHWTFAPMVDISRDPRWGRIMEGAGEDVYLSSAIAKARVLGFQGEQLGKNKESIMACAKHFPGHGDVGVDSHLDLPVITKSKAQLNDLEFYPFKQLIKAGVQSVMIAHLSVPALDDTKNLPTTLSKKVVTDLLKKEMGYNGLVFTDALDMKGLTKYFPEGEADLRAFMAGNDVLLFSQNVPLAIGKIQWAVKTGKLTPEELEARVKKILAAKYDVGLYKYSSLNEKNVTADLNSKTNELREKISRAAVTVVKDQAAMINKIKAGKGKIGYININGTGATHLDSVLQKKFPTLTISALPAKSTSAILKQLTDKTKDLDIVVVGVHNLALYPGKNGAYGLDAVQISALQQLSQKKNVIFAIMGNAYMVKNICNARSIVLGYEDDLYSEEAVFEVLTGVLKAKGTLPVKPCK